MVMASGSEGWWDLHTVYTHLRREGKGSWRHRGMGHLFMGSASNRLCSAECQAQGDNSVRTSDPAGHRECFRTPYVYVILQGLLGEACHLPRSSFIGVGGKEPQGA